MAVFRTGKKWALVISSLEKILYQAHFSGEKCNLGLFFRGKIGGSGSMLQHRSTGCYARSHRTRKGVYLQGRSRLFFKDK